MKTDIWDIYLPSLHSFMGDFGFMVPGSTPSSGAWPANNDAILVPFYLRRSMRFKRLFSLNGGTTGGNIDVGVYSKDGIKLASSGSQAQNGTNVLQFYNVSITLDPGIYYWAVAMSSTGGTLFRGNVNNQTLRTLGCTKMASAFPLPNTINFTAPTANYLPFVGAEVFGLI